MNTPNTFYTFETDIELDLNQVPRNHGATCLYTLPGRMDIIARYPFRLDLYPQEAYQEGKNIAEALFILTEEYGISFPGVSNLVPIRSLNPFNKKEQWHTYIAASFVDGLNMKDQIDKIPLSVTLQTLNTITQYYEDMLNDGSDRLYFTDISFRQLIYGAKSSSPGPGSEPSVEYVDYDPRLSNRKLFGSFHNPEGANFSDGINGLRMDVALAKRAWSDHSFLDIEGRIEEIDKGLWRLFLKS